ncbi:MAG TPA: bifunctional riboflavin kinase/FAD synthetase [Gemmatimonadaceae bacterium]|nr:bifunctional riboflavin kinase/FAD synthetase [Gemmatimonadaceae bacterium]
MIIVDGTGPLPLAPDTSGAAITVGTFDGVHRGHQDVIRRLVALAAERALTSVVVTFDPHPLEVVNPAAAPPLLTTREEKLAALAETGVSVVAMLPFTASLAAMSAEAFVDGILRERCHLAALLIGHDHGFGRDRMGDAGVLQALGRARGFSVDLVAPVQGSEGHPVSSTAIRRAVAGGDLARAADGLGRWYAAQSTVVHGEKRGRALGYPTINLAPLSSRKLLPPDGVYAVRVAFPDAEYGGMLNLGGRPTWSETERRLEAHVFDASGDWYGAPVTVQFVRRLREVRRFADAEALRAQLAEDEAVARAALLP